MAGNTWTEKDMPDQSGRVVVITGANSGLGYVASGAFAAKGATVVIACRSQAKGEAARASLLAAHPGTDLRLSLLDTSDLDSVRQFADRFLAGHGRLDVLLNNAGIMATPEVRTRQGHESQLATNHLGHFALTGLLLPRLLSTPGSRVVAVSSLAARSGKIALDDLMGTRKYDAWVAYNQSKLANLMFGIELQRRLARAGSSTTAYAAHPGASTTNLFATPGGSFIKKILTPIMGFMFQPAEMGTLPLLYAAAAKEAQPGGYYGPANMGEMKGPVAPAQVPPLAQDADMARRLWEVSEELTGVRYLD